MSNSLGAITDCGPRKTATTGARCPALTVSVGLVESGAAPGCAAAVVEAVVVAEAGLEGAFAVMGFAFASALSAVGSGVQPSARPASMRIKAEMACLIDVAPCSVADRLLAWVGVIGLGHRIDLGSRHPAAAESVEEVGDHRRRHE